MHVVCHTYLILGLIILIILDKEYFYRVESHLHTLRLRPITLSLSTTFSSLKHPDLCSFLSLGDQCTFYKQEGLRGTCLLD